MKRLLFVLLPFTITAQYDAILNNYQKYYLDKYDIEYTSPHKQIVKDTSNIINYGDVYISLRPTNEVFLTAIFNETIKITKLKKVTVNDKENDIQCIEIVEYVSDNYSGLQFVIMKKSYDGSWDIINQPEFDNNTIQYVNYPIEIGDCPICPAN
jgi:hypothetical protein